MSTQVLKADIRQAVKERFGEFPFGHVELIRSDNGKLPDYVQPIPENLPWPASLIYSYVQDLLLVVPNDEAIGPAVKLGNYELFEIQHSLKYIKPGDTVVDVGACIGYNSCIYSRAVGELGRVFSFEPDSLNYWMLKTNIQLNGCDNIIGYSFAAGDSSKYVDLYRSQNNAGDHSLGFSKDREKFWVPMRPLDSLTGYCCEINFLKIDVQGWESHVLRGARSLITNSPNLKMQVEYCPKALKEAGSSKEELASLIFDYGFKVESLYPLASCRDDGKLIINFGEGYGVRKLSKEELLVTVDENTDYFINLFCTR